MKKGRFSEAQIVAILKELDAGTTATELGRRHGIHANTIGCGETSTQGFRPATFPGSSNSRMKVDAKIALSPA